MKAANIKHIHDGKINVNGKPVINSRRKGREGQSEFANLLRDRDWQVDDTRAGKVCEDIIGRSPDGREWSIEVKKTVTCAPEHLAQARRQAKARRLPWMLAWRLPGELAWLVRRQGERSVVWHEEKQ